MSDTQALEALTTEVRQRLDALTTTTTAQLDERLSDSRLTELVKANLKSVLEEDPDFARKMRFGNTSDRKLVGTRYARAGMTTGDVELLFDMQNALAGKPKVDGAGVYTGPSEELRNTFEAISNGRYVDNAVAQAQDERELEDAYRARRIDRATFDAGLRSIRAAMDTAEAGYGSQLVGAEYVGELWEAARRDSRVFNLLDTWEMSAPTSYLPVEVDIPEMQFVSENTANNSSEYGTVKTGSQRVAVTAKKFVLHQMWSGEMEEDSIIPFVPFLRRQAGLGLAHYSDALALNGDDTNAGTGNINLDDADPADTKYYLAFDGIRHVALVDNTGNGLDVAGAISLPTFNRLRGLMIDTTRLVDWGHPIDPNDLVFVADPETADRAAMIDEVLTVDKFGPNATVLNGQLARVLGHPLIGSIAVPKTEADGKASTTGGSNTKGQLVAFNRRGFKVGWRRRIQLETERLPGRDQTRLVYSMRLGFGRFSPTGAASGIDAAAVAYNIAL